MAIISPVHPFTKAPANKPKVSLVISSTESTNFGQDKESGVNLRWYKRDEFANLSLEAKNEVHAWKKTSEGTNIMAASRNAHFSNKG